MAPLYKASGLVNVIDKFMKYQSESEKPLEIRSYDGYESDVLEDMIDSGT